MIGIKGQTAKFNAQAKQLNDFGRMVRKITNRQTLTERIQDTMEELMAKYPSGEATLQCGYLSVLMKDNPGIKPVYHFESDEFVIVNKKKWWQFWKKDAPLYFHPNPRKVKITYVQRGTEWN